MGGWQPTDDKMVKASFSNLVSTSWEAGFFGYEFGIRNDELAVGTGKIGGSNEKIPGYAAKRLGICSWASGRCLQRRIGFLTLLWDFFEAEFFSRSMWFSRKNKKETGEMGWKERYEEKTAASLCFSSLSSLLSRFNNKNSKLAISNSHCRIPS